MYISYLNKNQPLQILSRGLNKTHLIPSQVVAVLMQQVRDLLHIDWVIERCNVTNLTLVRGNLPLEALDQVTNGHTTGDSVGVDDDIWGDTLAGERHVLQTHIGKTNCYQDSSLLY